jgi:hypothetical protein
MSGQGKAAQASYSAGGLVFLAGRIDPKIHPLKSRRSSQAGDLYFAGIAC